MECNFAVIKHDFYVGVDKYKNGYSRDAKKLFRNVNQEIGQALIARSYKNENQQNQLSKMQIWSVNYIDSIKQHILLDKDYQLRSNDHKKEYYRRVDNGMLYVHHNSKYLGIAPR